MVEKAQRGLADTSFLYLAKRNPNAARHLRDEVEKRVRIQTEHPKNRTTWPPAGYAGTASEWMGLCGYLPGQDNAPDAGSTGTAYRAAMAARKKIRKERVIINGVKSTHLSK